MHPTSTPDRSEWSDERLDALARAMYPAIFGHPAPAPTPCNVVRLASRRARLEQLEAAAPVARQ
jgi:hypothetical protein